MKVALLSPAAPPLGGIAQWTDTVVEHLGHSSDVELVHINTSSGFHSIEGRSFYQRFVLQFRDIFRIKQQLSESLDKSCIDVAHITTSGGFGLLRDYFLLRYLRTRHVPTVYHIHYGRIPKMRASSNTEWQAQRKVLKLCSSIVVIDPLTQATLIDYPNVSFIPNPIEPIPYSPVNSKRLIFIGHVTPEKGVGELLEAWQSLQLQYPDWTLSIVGEVSDDYRRLLIDRFSCQNATFYGELSHSQAISELLKSSVLVLPSHSEGFPYSVCEAMFAGKAVVATRVGAIPYQLSDNCGYLCDPYDTDGLIMQLSQVMESATTRQSLGANAAARALNLFSADTIISKYDALWHRISTGHIV